MMRPSSHGTHQQHWLLFSHVNSTVLEKQMNWMLTNHQSLLREQAGTSCSPCQWVPQIFADNRELPHGRNPQGCCISSQLEAWYSESISTLCSSTAASLPVWKNKFKELPLHTCSTRLQHFSQPLVSDSAARPEQVSTEQVPSENPASASQKFLLSAWDLRLLFFFS